MSMGMFYLNFIPVLKVTIYKHGNPLCCRSYSCKEKGDSDVASLYPKVSYEI